VNCTIIPTVNLTNGTFVSPDAATVAKLTKPGSLFARRLAAREPIEGFIALLFDFGELVGWARTEQWHEETDESWRAIPITLPWNTLEAFVKQDYRGRGLATFAAAGLVTLPTFREDNTAAVFTPSMMLLARKVGLQPTLFREESERWVRA
jgi:hypothetical protein